MEFFFKIEISEGGELERKQKRSSIIKGRVTAADHMITVPSHSACHFALLLGDT